jgi:HEAT repeat protein
MGRARRLGACAVLSAFVLSAAIPVTAAPAPQEPPSPQPVRAAELQAAIDKLGDLDYEIRTNASRTVRRTPAAQAVPALRRAVSEHKDGYVRYRALVLLTGFNDPRTFDSMREVLTSPNDRLRTVAYSFFEHHPERADVTELVAALDREHGEFVRPHLVRALASYGSKGGPDSTRVQQLLLRESGRGEDFFRSAVIEAFGDFKARYAVEALTRIVKLDGPLQDDAALALGKIGDRRALETLAGLQKTAPRNVQPSIVTAICLIGLNCESHRKFLAQSVLYASTNRGFQELLRGAGAGLGVLAIAGQREALDILFEVGIPAQEDSTRAPIALAVATVALRKAPLLLEVLAGHADRTRAIELMAEGFDMLEEDLDKETFFASIRRSYWESSSGSRTRALMQALIQKLDF